MRAVAREVRKPGKSLALVPTMGALHEGHLSLIRRAKRQCDAVAASIFVNPRQFDSAEDLKRYPRNLDRDLKLLDSENVNFVFTPSAEEMYAENFSITVDAGPLAHRLEGALRPGHFEGVASVVLKLFNIIRPDVAYFGQKDFQQAMVIRRLIEDLNLDVRLAVCPIVRDPAGLALSSRNTLLSSQESVAALMLSRSLVRARDMVWGGETAARKVQQEIAREFATNPMVSLDYAEIVDPMNFIPVERIAPGSVALLAARVGSVRLIDNLIFGPPNASADLLLQVALSASPVVSADARIPGLETETLRQSIEACRQCAAISHILLPPREFLAQYVRRDYPDLNVVRVAVIGRDSPANPRHFVYRDADCPNLFTERLFELLGIESFTEFKERFVLTDSIRCHATGPRVPGKAMESCSNFLLRELRLFPNLDTLVVLGQDAYFAVQRHLMGRSPDRILPFESLLEKKGWASERVEIPAIGSRGLQIFYCFHPTTGYVRSPSLRTVLNVPAEPEFSMQPEGPVGTSEIKES